MFVSVAQCTIGVESVALFTFVVALCDALQRINGCQTLVIFPVTLYLAPSVALCDALGVAGYGCPGQVEWFQRDAPVVALCDAPRLALGGHPDIFHHQCSVR